jgi:hypothetical protein
MIHGALEEMQGVRIIKIGGNEVSRKWFDFIAKASSLDTSQPHTSSPKGKPAQN